MEFINAADGIIPTLEGMEKLAFEMLRPKIDRDDLKYEDKRIHAQYMAYKRQMKEKGKEAEALSEDEWRKQQPAVTSSNYSLPTTTATTTASTMASATATTSAITAGAVIGTAVAAVEVEGLREEGTQTSEPPRKTPVSTCEQIISDSAHVSQNSFDARRATEIAKLFPDGRP